MSFAAVHLKLHSYCIDAFVAIQYLSAVVPKLLRAKSPLGVRQFTSEFLNAKSISRAVRVTPDKDARHACRLTRCM